jgi:hypothetical protein
VNGLSGFSVFAFMGRPVNLSLWCNAPIVGIAERDFACMLDGRLA